MITSIKQEKGLEMILSVSFILEAVAVNPHHAVKGSFNTSETNNCETSKQNKSIREIAGTFRVAKSTVGYILRKKRRHW